MNVQLKLPFNFNKNNVKFGKIRWTCRVYKKAQFSGKDIFNTYTLASIRKCAKKK